MCANVLSKVRFDKILVFITTYVISGFIGIIDLGSALAESLPQLFTCVTESQIYFL